MDSLYRDLILDHYRNPQNFGTLSEADASHEENNPFCGDHIGMALKTSDQRPRTITDIRFHGEGCAISMACASMLTEKVLGKNLEEVRELKKEDILDMLGTELTPTRLKCALLPLEVLQKALQKLR